MFYSPRELDEQLSKLDPLARVFSLHEIQKHKSSVALASLKRIIDYMDLGDSHGCFMDVPEGFECYTTHMQNIVKEYPYITKDLSMQELGKVLHSNTTNGVFIKAMRDSAGKVDPFDSSKSYTQELCDTLMQTFDEGVDRLSVQHIESLVAGLGAAGITCDIVPSEL